MMKVLTANLLSDCSQQDSGDINVPLRSAAIKVCVWITYLLTLVIAGSLLLLNFSHTALRLRLKGSELYLPEFMWT